MRQAHWTCAAGLAATLIACGPQRNVRTAWRAAHLLDDGRTGVVSLSWRETQPGPVDPLGLTRGEVTLRHRAIVGTIDVTSGATRELFEIELGPARDGAHVQFHWSLGTRVLAHVPALEPPRFDWALLDVATGSFERFDLERDLGPRGTPQVGDVRLVAGDGSLAIEARAAGVDPRSTTPHLWLRTARGAYVLLGSSARLARLGAGEIVYEEVPSDAPARFVAYVIASGDRRVLEPRDVAGLTLPDEDRPNLLQVRPPDGGAHAEPWLGLARRVGPDWVENVLAVDPRALVDD